MVPVPVTVPPVAVQVTPVTVVLPTVAVRLIGKPVPKVAVEGDTEIVGCGTVMVEVPDCRGSAKLVAVTV